MRKIVAGNWKSQKLMDDGQNLINALVLGLSSRTNPDTRVIVAPPAPYIAAYAMQIHKQRHSKNLELAAQQCSAHDFGAHTGEFTASMIQSAGATSVIIGHSERRDRFGENDEVVRAKLNQGIAQGLTNILCCGEHLDKRQAGMEKEVVAGQLKSALSDATAAQMAEHVVIAYEPVWAIGTGETATAGQAQDMHAYIRSFISDHFGSTTAAQVPILYGGSCKPGNAAEIFAGPDVDGGLIGGAALNADDFLAIIAASDAS